MTAPRWSDRVVRLTPRGVELLFAGVWAVAAVTKLLDPFVAYEFAVQVVGGGAGAKVALAVGVGLEALLATTILFRVVNGLWPSAVLLGTFTGALLFVRSKAGGALACGCFGSANTIDDELVTNAILGVLLLGGFAARVLVRRKEETE